MIYEADALASAFFVCGLFLHFDINFGLAVQQMFIGIVVGADIIRPILPYIVPITAGD